MRETTIGSRVVKARGASAYTSGWCPRARMPAVPTDTADDKLTDPTRVLLRRLVIVLILVACGIGAAVAVQHTRRGDDTVTVLNGEPRPNVVKLISPGDGSNVLSQAQIEIDLDTKYDANLVVNGIPIPPDQLQRRPEL